MMSGYYSEAFVRFGDTMRQINHQPHKRTLFVYGRTTNHAKEGDAGPKLDKEKTKSVRQVTGTFLYYIREVDTITMMALGAIAADQVAPTEKKTD